MGFDFEGHTFAIPAKHIVAPHHVEQWNKSQGCAELSGFINALADSVRSSKMSETEMNAVSAPFFTEKFII